MRRFTFKCLFCILTLLSSRAQDLNWQSVNPSLSARGLDHLRVLNDTLIAYGRFGRVMTSDDGVSWDSINLPTNTDVRSLAYGNGLFVAIGERGEVYRRTPSTPWSLNFAVNDVPNTGSTVFSTLAFGNGVFVRGGRWSASVDFASAVSTDGLVWSSSELPLNIEKIHFTGDRFIAARQVDTSRLEMWSSVDGRGWTEVMAPTKTSAIWGNFVQHDDTLLLPLNTGFMRSTDGGASWTYDSSQNLARLHAIDGNFYAEARDVGTYLSSTDGETWTELARGVPAASRIGAAKLGSTYVTISSGDQPAFHVSTDAQTWIPLGDTVLPLDRPEGLVAGNGIFNAAGGYLSVDGLQWVSGGFWPADRGYAISLHFCHDRFFYVETRKSGAALPTEPPTVYSSIDGRAGSAVFVATSNAEKLGAPVYLNGTFFIPTSAGNLVSHDGTTWERDTTGATSLPALAGNGNYLARVGTYTTIYRKEEPLIEVSTDGDSWTPGYRFPPDAQPGVVEFKHWVDSIVAGDGRFVAGLVTSDWHSNHWSRIAYSPNGLQWSTPETSIPGNHALNFNDGWFTCYSQDGDTFVQFVTKVSDGVQFHYSRDGAEWKTAPMHDATPRYLATNGNVFLAASATGELWRAALGPRTPPVIVASSLESTTLRRGETTTLSVDATGSGPFSYQWRRDGVHIPTADGPSLRIEPSADWESARFDVVISNELGRTQSDAAVVKFSDSWLSNLSSRAFADSAQAQVVQGFVLQQFPAPTGRGQSASILTRAVGPTLAQFGIETVLPDPRIELIALDTPSVVPSNDNWFTNDPWRGGRQFYLSKIFQEAGAFPLTESSADAALSVSPNPGHYTINVTDAANRSGYVLTELYDYRYSSSLTRLTNLSTRAPTGPGDSLLIMGFVVAGNRPLQVLIRGVGPGLSAHGIDRPLTNPRISLHNASGAEIHNNDTWYQARNVDELRAAMQTVGAFPLSENSNDAAMLEWLEPGVYTLMIHSQDESAGIALGEIYEVR